MSVSLFDTVSAISWNWSLTTCAFEEKPGDQGTSVDVHEMA
jgi:hypothetical protein